MKVILFKQVTFAADLSYDQACDLQRKANASPMSKLFSFAVAGKAHTQKWSLVGYPTLAPQNQVLNIDECVIHTDKE